MRTWPQVFGDIGENLVVLALLSAGLVAVGIVMYLWVVPALAWAVGR